LSGMCGIPSKAFYKFMACLSLAASLAFFCPAAHAGPPVKATATFLPVYIFAVNVAGDRADVSLLIPPGMDVHAYSLRPHDIKKLQEADMVFLSGAGLDDFIAVRIRDRAKTVDTSRGVRLLRSGLAPDPHIWLDPARAMLQVENIRDAFSKLDPANEGYYRANAEAYMERLGAVDKEAAEAIGRLGTKYLVTYHESFAYFGDRYGLLTYSLTGPDAQYPLPGRVKEVYDMVGARGIKAVFAEKQFPPQSLDRLKRDLGVRVCTLDTIETGEPRAGYYEEAMRLNLRTIIDCLGGK
jgi:zinc transport system substrate-binding protein